MIYNYNFDIAAAILNLVLIALAFFRKSYPSRKVSIYRAMLLTHMGAIIFDIASSIAMSDPTRFTIRQNYFLIMGYYLFYNATSIIYVLYGLACERKTTNLVKERKPWLILGAIEFVMIVTSPFTKFVYGFEGGFNYVNGFGLYFLYAAGVFDVAYVLYLKIKNKDNRNGFQIITSVFYVVCLASAFIIHSFIKDLLIELFAISVGFFVMYLSQDNPESYLYKGLAVYNKKAFDEELDKLIIQGDDFEVLLFTPTDSEDYVNNKTKLFTIEKEILEVIRKNKRFSDIFVLYENCYGVICHDDEDDVIDEIKKIFSKPIEISGYNRTIQMSFGIFRYPDIATNFDDACIVIDDLNYYLSIHSSEQLLEATRRSLIDKENKDIEHALRKAIKNDDIIVEYEPIFDCVKELSFNAQAKIKLLGKNGELIDSKEFLPVAERTGLVYELDAIILEKIYQFIEQTKVHDLGIDNIVINIAVRRFSDINFSEDLKQLTTKAKIDPKKICIEISGVRRFRNDPVIINNVKEVAAMGFKLVLDDFGDNTANLLALTKTPFTAVKLSKSIISDALINKRSKIILDSILKLLKDLKIGASCDEINTKEEYELIKNTYCEFVQGAYFSKDLTGKQYIAFLRKQLKQILDEINN